MSGGSYNLCSTHAAWNRSTQTHARRRTALPAPGGSILSQNQEERIGEPICKLCGHHADNHLFRIEARGGPMCKKCPDRTCQDGPDGKAYRGEAVIPDLQLDLASAIARIEQIVALDDDDALRALLIARMRYDARRLRRHLTPEWTAKLEEAAT